MSREPIFCSRCGGQLRAQLCDGRLRPVCAACGFIAYLNPAPSVAAILNLDGRLLLVKRIVEPGLGLWSLPGGFIEAGETIEQAVVREVEEETGLLSRPTGILDAQAVLGGFYGDILVLCYTADVIGGELRAGGDAGESRFFDADRLPNIAFDVHGQFLDRYARNASNR